MAHHLIKASLINRRIMKKATFVLAMAVAFLSYGGAAFAYELPSSVSTQSSVSLGAGEVDLSRPAVVEGTITVDSIRGSAAWVTAGDVSNGATGFGFCVVDNMLYLVSNTGSFPFRMPVAFVRVGDTVKVRAAYTPGEAIRFDTWATEQYSRGILQNFLPSVLRGIGALNVQVGGHTPATVTVGSWHYSQK